ncbi:MAG: alginate lyase family protein [Gloeobacteraceae cyanobacterium ES-bin-144]|nr:alginate lyase family protein [Verrucomicrobiales bacterium]
MTLSRLTILLTLALAILPAGAQVKFTHPGAIYTVEEIKLAKSRAAAGKQPWKDAYDSLIREADSALNVKPDAPEKFDLPWRYKDAKGHMAAGARIRSQSWAAYTLGLGSLMTEDAAKSKIYATQCAAMLKEWTRCKNIGLREGDEAEAALAACNSGNGFIAAADFIYNSPHWSAADRTEFKQWIREVYLKATEIKTMKFENNWNAWGTCAALLSDYVLEDATALQADKALLVDVITKQIEPDGKMPKELDRGNGKNWYTYFALSAITQGAVVVRNATGDDLMKLETPTGKLVQQGIDYFVTNLFQAPYSSLVEAAGGFYNNKKYLTMNRSRRPIIGIREHNGWNYPTLFLQPDEIPINQMPIAAAVISPSPAKAGVDLVFNASSSRDPDGEIKFWRWSFEGEKTSKSYIEPLYSAGDILHFPTAQLGRFQVDFDLKVDIVGDAAVGLQSSSMSGTSWRKSSYLFSINEGKFAVRDGSAYRAETEVSYELGKTYHIRFVVDVLRKTWSVSIIDGDKTIPLATNYMMRDGADAVLDISKLLYMGPVGMEITKVRMESSSQTMEGMQVNRKFDTPGSKAISLTVTDDVGALHTKQITLEVQ